MKVTELLDIIGVDELLSAAQSDEYLGYCIVCGAEASGVEPDARRYPCESCGEDRVYGAEELLIRLEPYIR